MKKEEAAEVLMTIKSYHTGLVKPEALDLAIAALRESAEPDEKEQAMRWYLKGFEDAETTERQPVSHEQTMRDAETHFHFVWDANEALREQPAPPAIEWKPGPPKEDGRYLIALKDWYERDTVYAENDYRIDDPINPIDHITHHAAWPQYPGHV